MGIQTTPPLFVLLGRPDLAAVCFRPLSALTTDTIRRLHSFCASEDSIPGPGSLREPKEETADDSLCDEELRSLGLCDAVVQLRGVLLSHQDCSVSELVGKLVETLAYLV